MPRRKPTNAKNENRRVKEKLPPGRHLDDVVDGRVLTKRSGLSIFWKLLLICVLPAVITFGGFGFMAHYESRATLERELGRRLVAVAQAGASTMRLDEVLFLEPGDEESRVYKSLQRRLENIRDASGMSRVFLINTDMQSIVDTQEGQAIGDRFYHLDVQHSFLMEVLEKGSGSSLLYKSGGKYYKSGFAVIRDEDGEPRAIVVVEGRAEQYEILGALSRRLFMLGGGGALILIALSAFFARRMAVPLKKLESAAKLMAGGTLDQPIHVQGSGEVALVSHSMEKMRQELQRRDEQLRMMLAGVAHEVRNPLGGMELIVGMLREDLEGEPEKIDAVDRIKRELDYLGKVVKDFLEYARWDLKETMAVNLADAVKEGMELLAPEAAKHGVTLDSGTVPAEILVMCAREEVRRVVLNMVGNAIHAAGEHARALKEDNAGGQLEDPAEGTVWAEISRCERNGVSFVELWVCDNGPGVDPEYAEKIFEPFYTSKQQGTGLGLALGRKVAEAHGGYLEVRTERNKTGGAVFVLGLPGASVSTNKNDA